MPEPFLQDSRSHAGSLAPEVRFSAPSATVSAASPGERLMRGELDRRFPLTRTNRHVKTTRQENSEAVSPAWRGLSELINYQPKRGT